MQQSRVAHGHRVISACWSDSDRGLPLLPPPVIRRLPWAWEWDWKAINSVTHSPTYGFIKDKPKSYQFYKGAQGRIILFIIFEKNATNHLASVHKIQGVV